jgi:pyridoxal 5'-phosphate synthase pdxS subunit
MNKHELPVPTEYREAQRGLASMLKGGVIMDVMNVEQAKIAEEAGACAVMALERIPADIRTEGGVSRASDPGMIQQIMKAVSIPVMAKVRIGHFVEAQILDALNVDFVDESEVLTIADNAAHIEKNEYQIPFVCGCRNLGEALRRIGEGADMIRTKGEAGTGDISEAIYHIREVRRGIQELVDAPDEDAVREIALRINAPLKLCLETRKLKRLPRVTFAAGGVATPADAAMCMQMGMDGVFVGSGIFKSGNPLQRAKAMVQAVTHYEDPQILLEVSQNLGPAMVGINAEERNQKWSSKERN